MREFAAVLIIFLVLAADGAVAATQTPPTHAVGGMRRRRISGKTGRAFAAFQTFVGIKTAVFISKVAAGRGSYPAF